MRLAITALLAAFSLAGFSQDRTGTMPGLSPLTRLYLQKAKEAHSNTPVPNYVYKQINNKLYISALAKVTNAVDETALNQLGILVGTKAGNIWTMQVPTQNLEPFTQIRGIDYIELDVPMAPLMDSARKATRADSAQMGFDLPGMGHLSFNGEGVVMGILDVGFDYTHPTLFDTTGTHYRIKKIWEQKSTGTPPSGFSYGNEMTDTVAMQAKGTDNNTQTHGTHVLGIAAGSGYGGSTDNSKFRGMAYRSDMVLVGITPPRQQWINTGASDMIDGMNYVFTYAASVSKPAVVNLSWGNPVGPRDGTSLFSQACDNLTGKGKIFVCSAGNSGEEPLHLKKVFTATDTITQTFVTIPTTPAGNMTWVDIWGEQGKTFCASVTLYNSLTKGNATSYFCLDNLTHNTYLIGSNNDTLFIDFVTESSSFNQKPRIFIEFRSKITDNICLSIKSTDGTIHAWDNIVIESTGYPGAFSDIGQSWATPGNTDITVSDLATSKSAITVGAYASKTDFRNISGTKLSYASYVTVGNIVPFSSHGPAVDGRVKPDITAPGMTLCSAISSYDNQFQSGGSQYSSVTTSYHDPKNNRDYGYGMLSGTSMSSPCVSGIVAMLLQVNAQLTPQNIKDSLTSNAIKDKNTGTIPTGGNNIWGNGKINAYRTIRQLVLSTSTLTNTANTVCKLYPNPANGTVTLSMSGSTTETLSITVIDIAGRIMMQDSWTIQKGLSKKELNVTNFPAGNYIIQLKSANESMSVQMAVVQ